MKKVGLLGGSFDPIHLGHVGIAQAAIAQLALDEVWFIVAFQTNLKDELSAGFFERLAMVEIAIAGDSHLKVCDVEKNLPVPSYTINTMEVLIKQYPEVNFTFLIGSDQAEQLDKWHRFDELLKMVEFKIISRDGKPGDVHLSADQYPQSSTAIRAGKVEYADPLVWQYILKHRLYLKNIVAGQLTEKRFAHVLAVLNTALALAAHYNYDASLCYFAALFHDIAKELDKNLMKAYLSAQERQSPKGIWHQFVSAKITRDYYRINDEAVFQAIYHHTTGDCTELLAMIIFCADKVEPTRDYDSGDLLALCFQDLPLAFKTIKEQQESFVKKKRVNQ